MKKLFCFVVVLILFVLSITVVNATIFIRTPEIAINQETRECAEVTSSLNTVFPSGWVSYESYYGYIGGNVENAENYVMRVSIPIRTCTFEAYDIESCCEKFGYTVVPDPSIDISILIAILALGIPILLFLLLLKFEFRKNIVKNKQVRGAASWTGIKSVLIGPLLVMFFLLLYLRAVDLLFFMIIGVLVVIPNFLCFLIARSKANHNSYFKTSSILGISIVIPYIMYASIFNRAFFEYDPLILLLVFYHIFMNLSILIMRIKKG